MNLIQQVAQQLNLGAKQVENVLNLLDGGATIPFISRYRKEATGSMDEVDIAKVQKEFQRLTELEKRRAFILESVQEAGKATPEWIDAVKKAILLSELEDLYLPF